MKYIHLFLLLFASSISLFGQKKDDSKGNWQPGLPKTSHWISEWDSIKNAQEMRFRSLYPKNLSGTFFPSIQNYQIDQVIDNSDGYIRNYIREEYGKTSQYEFKSKANSVYLLILALPFLVISFIKERDYTRISALSLIYVVLLYLSSMLIGKTLGDYILILEFNLITGLLLSIPIIAINLGYTYFLNKLSLLTSQQKWIILIGITLAVILLLGYLTGEHDVTNQWFVYLSSSYLNLAGAILIPLIIGFVTFQNNKQRA